MNTSRFYDIDAYWENNARREGWRSKDEFARVVLALEQKSRPELVQLLSVLEVDYPVIEQTDEEDLVSVLISDVSPEEFRKLAF